jgi:tetratricopeptide (TPR) repeat protein
VKSRNSVFRYKGRETDAQAVGRELGVRAVLTGRVTQHGDALLIGVELVDVRDNNQIWGEHYNRRLADIVTVQEEISKEISEKLRLRLTGEEQKRLSKPYTENTEAYQLYLKGRYHWNRRPRGLREGIKYFEQAIEKDPSYALAYTGLADSYGAFATWEDGTVSPDEIMPKAAAAAIKALEIDETLAEAHSSLAYIRLHYDWDWLGTEKELKRAIELNPNSANAHHWYSHCLMTMGRTQESWTESQRALELDPLDPIINGHQSWHYYYAHQYDQSIEKCQKMLQMDSNSFWAHFELGRGYEQKGMYKEAIAQLNSASTLARHMTWARGALGHAYAVSGQRSQAQRVLDQLEELSKERYVSPSDIAIVHVGLGETDQALGWLQKAFQERCWYLVLLKLDPRLDSLRSDPRFQDLVRSVGLPP